MISSSVDSNEQTELTSKMETVVDREQAGSSGGEAGGWRERAKKKKKEKEPRDTDNSVEIAG